MKIPRNRRFGYFGDNGLEAVVVVVPAGRLGVEGRRTWGREMGRLAVRRVVGRVSGLETFRLHLGGIALTSRMSYGRALSDASCFSKEERSTSKLEATSPAPPFAPNSGSAAGSPSPFRLASCCTEAQMSSRSLHLPSQPGSGMKLERRVAACQRGCRTAA